MVDIDAAVGYVVARGDSVERAWLSHLRTGTAPAEDVFANVEAGQSPAGGWPAQLGDRVASIDATCFRLALLDDLDALGRPPAVRALRWLASRQRRDGSWEEDPALARSAPLWARPGDPEARFYLTANATFWISVVQAGTESQMPAGDLTVDEPPAGNSAAGGPIGLGISPLVLERAAEALVASLGEDGSWPGFLVSGWLAAGALHRTGRYYEAARILVMLTERARTMSAADAAAMASTLVRAGISAEDSAVVAARARLSATQLPDGSWPSDDAPALDVHTTLTALRVALNR